MERLRPGDLPGRIFRWEVATLGTLTTLVVLGLASWIFTCIVVESELFAGIRRLVDRWYSQSVNYLVSAKTAHEFERNRETMLAAFARGERPPIPRYKRALVTVTFHLRYMIGCHLCTGMWVSLGIAAFLPPVVGPWFIGWVLNGAIIKAIAHMALALQHAAEAYAKAKETPPANNGFTGKQPTRLTQFDPAQSW